MRFLNGFWVTLQGDTQIISLKSLNFIYLSAYRGITHLVGSIDILVILDRLCGRGSWSEHRDQLLGVNNALKDTKIVCEMLRLWLFFTFLQSLVTAQATAYDSPKYAK